MGQEDDSVATSVAHIVLCCVAGRGLSRTSKNFIHPGMHANFFIHGVIGFLHYQSGRVNHDFTSIYQISMKASKYLALPCLMADLYRGNNTICAVHLLSGVIPFVLALTGNDNPHLGHLMIACNVASMCYYAQQRSSVWGWYTAGAAVVAYFVTTQVKKSIIYPLALALMEYCAYRMFHHRFDEIVVIDPRAPPPRRR